jgi:hypothetical protein
MTKESLWKWRGQNDVLLQKQCDHILTLQLFKNDY